MGDFVKVKKKYYQKIKKYVVLDTTFLDHKNGKVLTEDGLNGGNTKYAVRTYNDADRSDWGPFEFNKLANHGGVGIWSHTNYRKDKFDVYPYPPLIEMLKSL